MSQFCSSSLVSILRSVHEDEARHRVGATFAAVNIAYFIFFLFDKLAYMATLSYRRAPGLVEIEGRCFILVQVGYGFAAWSGYAAWSSGPRQRLDIESVVSDFEILALNEQLQRHRCVPVFLSGSSV